jgi:GTP cyclohydrolase II
MSTTVHGLAAVTPLRTHATERTRVRIPLRFADGYAVTAEAVTFHGLVDGQEHVAMVFGDPSTWDVPLVRLHSECLTGDVFGSTRCDCGPQLREAVERIASTGGVLLYLRQEGRGIGLYNKLDAYALQDDGLDTYEANTALGIDEVDLLSNNPDKVQQLRDLGVTVRSSSPTGVFATDSNLRYLHAKVVHTQHDIDLTGVAGLVG